LENNEILETQGEVFHILDLGQMSWMTGPKSIREAWTSCLTVWIPPELILSLTRCSEDLRSSLCFNTGEYGIIFTVVDKADTGLIWLNLGKHE